MGKMSMEEAIRFLDVLESENEEELTRIIEMIQNVEQKIREVEYSLQEMGEKQDSNMNFFSPVGVYEEGEEKRELLKTAEELKDKLPALNEKLKQYKHRTESIQFLRNTLLAIPKEAENASVESTPVEKERGLHILESQEHDRNRIAADLHDSSVQSLTGLVHKTELCMRLVDIDTVRVKLELQTMIETIRTVINGMREIIYNLRPMSLDNLGLLVTIDSYCLQLRKSQDIDVEFICKTEEPEMSSIYKVTLYRILQEACCNILKHAKATKIEITLLREGDNLKLLIRDNGTGFDIEKVNEPSEERLYGFGLSMMKERAVLLGGFIKIESQLGVGTVVSIEVPLQEKEEKSGND